MTEAQILHELRLLHDRCDTATSAINTLTREASENMLRVRAYENIINRSWFLTRWFAQWKIVREMNQIDAEEGKLRQAREEREERAIEQQRIVDEREAKEAAGAKAADGKTDKREKKLDRAIRKGEDV